MTTNFGFQIAMVDTNITIGRVLLVGDKFVIVGSNADHTSHNWEQEPSRYDWEEILFYPIEVGLETFLYNA